MKIKKYKNILLLLVLVILSITLTACYTNFDLRFGQFDKNYEEDINQSDPDLVQDALIRLDQAEQITVKKDLINIFSDKWTVSDENGVIGEVKGEVIRYLDTYTFRTEDGHFLGAEEETKNLLGNDNKALVFNEEGQEDGYIQQSLIDVKYRARRVDADGNLLASIDRDFVNLLGDQYNIEDARGSLAYRVDETILSLGTKYEIVKQKDSNVSGIDAVWLTIIASEVNKTGK